MLAQILNSGSEFGMLACQLGKECSFQAFFFFLKAPCLQQPLKSYLLVSPVMMGLGFINSHVLLLSNEDSVQEMEAGSNSPLPEFVLHQAEFLAVFFSHYITFPVQLFILIWKWRWACMYDELLGFFFVFWRNSCLLETCRVRHLQGIRSLLQRASCCKRASVVTLWF